MKQAVTTYIIFFIYFLTTFKYIYIHMSRDGTYSTTKCYIFGKISMHN